MHRPSWFREDEVLISSAPTCGINKDGHDQFTVDEFTGTRSTSEIDDQLAIDVDAAISGQLTKTLRYIPIAKLGRPWSAVPTYFNAEYDHDFDSFMTARPPGWRSINLGQLIDQEFLLKRQGHGSPSADQRIGTVPYIKVSDLRAGLVNINPTNMIPRPLAEHFWSGPSSGLDAYDLLCPERASKNIGDFCVLMPGQENVVLTKEVIVLRVLPAAQFDSFYLLWALTLSVVRKQWERIIFMQTNREDVGNRFREIQIPIAPNRIEADTISTAFRTYFEKLSEARNGLAKYLADSADHHYFLDA